MQFFKTFDIKGWKKPSPPETSVKKGGGPKPLSWFAAIDDHLKWHFLQILKRIPTNSIGIAADFTKKTLILVNFMKTAVTLKTLMSKCFKICYTFHFKWLTLCLLPFRCFHKNKLHCSNKIMLFSFRNFFKR